MAPYPSLHTPRLTLKPLQSDDADAIQHLFPRWEVVRYLSNKVPWPYPEDGARDFVDNIALPSVAAGKLLIWSLRLTSAPETLMGVINLRLPDTDSAGEWLEVQENRGFWLAPEHQGNGYMTEAAEAVTDYWFNVLEQPLLRTTKVADNTGSRGVSKRTGMRLAGHTLSDFVGGNQCPTDIWEITRAQWRDHKASGGYADKQ